MRTVILVGMLAALLVTAWLVLKSVTEPTAKGNAPLVTIDRARDARGAAERAQEDAGRTIDEASRE